MRRRRLLVLSFYPCFFPPRSGGETRLYNLYHNLADRFDIRILSSSHVDSGIDTVVHAPSLVEQRFGKAAPFAECYAAAGEIGGAGDLSGLAVGLYGAYPNEMTAAYADHYEWADIIIHESPFTVYYDLMLGLDHKPRVYDAHNAEHVLMRALHPGAGSTAIHEFTDAAERVLVNAADLVAYCAEDDRAAFERLCGQPLRDRAIFVPNGSALPARDCALEPREKARKLVFIGSRHAPNVEAARFLIDRLAPRLPQLELHIVGACATPGRPRPNVICHGEIAGPLKAQIFAESDIALNPVVSGSGSNLKVLDYMASGLPVVATEFGMRGIAAEPGRHYVPADIPKFIDAVGSFAADKARRAEIADAALQHIHQRLTWPAIARAFGDALQELASRKVGEPRLALFLNDYDPTSGFGGGATRMLGVQSALAKQSLVVLLCFHEGETIERVWLAESHLVIKVPKTPAHWAETRRLDALCPSSAADVVNCRFAVANPILLGFYRMLRRRASVIVVEHPYMVPLIDEFGDEFVYSSHNDELALKSDLLADHPEKQDLLETVREAEDFCLRAAKLVVAVSDYDASAFTRRQRMSGGPVVVVPNGADSPIDPKPEDDAKAAVVGPRSAVFLGSAHMPNIEARDLLCATVAASLPDVEFHVLGSVGRVSRTIPMPLNVRIWGEVEAGLKTAIMRRAAIALNPIYSGGGSNVKLSDYFAHGLPTVTSEFGLRGYPASVRRFVEVAEAPGFATGIERALERYPPHGAHREKIVGLFAKQLSMVSHAARFADCIRELDAPRRRMLVVTYRYTDPALGGAEVLLRELVRRVDATGDWAIDVVCADVGTITDRGRFTCDYGDASEYGAPHGLAATRWRRFPAYLEAIISAQVLQAWRVQADFEHFLAAEAMRGHIECPRLLTGWYDAEPYGSDVARWTSHCATFHTGDGGRLTMRGWSPAKTEFLLSCGGAVLGTCVDGSFEFEADVPLGVASLRVEARQLVEGDIRPLGLRLTHLGVGGRSLLTGPTLIEDLKKRPLGQRMEALDRAARASRWPENVRLTSLRGPHSPELKAWLASNIGNYDVLLTHNCVFLPPAEALRLARERGVPSVFIPQIHLDDDFYHFPDVMQAIRDASVSLVSPRAAVDFLRREVTPDVRYFGSGGVEPDEFGPATEERDLAAFRKHVADDGTPVVLVLGRKAAAKNYGIVIEAQRLLVARGIAVRVVLIGPDDDKAPVTGRDVVYLGLQPRDVVRGALRSATVLVNMSASESFGIVLLEAWLAGTPVIANRHCAAFADLVEHGIDGFLAEDATSVAQNIATLVADPALAVAQAERGRDIAMSFTWSRLAKELHEICIQLADGEVPLQAAEVSDSAEAELAPAAA